MKRLSLPIVPRPARPPARPHAVSAATVLALLFLVSAPLLSAPRSAEAEVAGLEITRRVPLLGGRGFEAAPKADRTAPPDAPIPYELIEGFVDFAFDPASPANARVTDIEHAPVGPQGRIAARAELVVLQPIDPAQRRGTAIVDVPNRGRRLALSTFNRAPLDFTTSPQLDPDAPGGWGDGFLMSEGLTVIWVGWQADAPRVEGSMRLRVPRAIDAEGDPIRGRARSDWVVDEATRRLSLATRGHVPHPAARPDSAANRLTRRRGREALRQDVPRSQWRFDDDRGAIVAAPGAPDFEAGWIYELVYEAEGPPLVGLGFAAFRDIAAWAETDPACPFPVERTIAHGLSQSGRFLRHLLFEGMNRDEAGRPVFDGVMIQIGGGGRGGFNHRFAHPGRVGNPYQNFFYPGDDFPFTSRKTRRPGEEDGAGLLDRLDGSDALPKIFQVNTGYEYWGRVASLVHMTPDGAADVRPHPSERLYHIASAPHGSLPFPPDPRAEVQPGLFVGSSVDTSPIQRALLLHLLRWVEQDVAPPDSLIPTVADGTLVPPGGLAYPMGSLVPPRTPHLARRLDFGPQWDEGIVDHQPPRPGRHYAIRVPAIDALGNELSGIRPLELRAPIGTWTPWALRHGKPGGSDEMTGYLGSFWPLALDEASRRPGDARPPLATIHPDREAYERRVAEAIDAMVDAGWMLRRDRVEAYRAAMARWSWIHERADADTQATTRAAADGALR